MRTHRIYIFAGTTEGRLLVEAAVKKGRAVDVFVATEAGADALAEITAAYADQIGLHVGRLDEEGMRALFIKDQPTLVLDATHPFATEVTANIRTAAEQADVSYVRLLRREEECKHTKDLPHITWVKDSEEAARILSGQYRGRRIFLATGSKDIAIFSHAMKKEDIYRVLVRVLPGEANVARVVAAGITRENIIEGRGPFALVDNMDLLRQYHIDVMVTKETGSAGGFHEKLTAAAMTETDVIVIRRPKEREGISLEEAVELL